MAQTAPETTLPAPAEAVTADQPPAVAPAAPAAVAPSAPAASSPAPAAADPFAVAAAVAAGHRLNAAEGLAILSTPDEDTLRLVTEAGRLRRRHFGNTVKVNYLVNLKSGLCPEDCTYCSQRLGSTAEILKYTWLKPDEAVEQAKMGIGGGASRVCLVASGRGPTDRDVDRVATMTEGLKAEHPEVEVCACLGLLKDGQADRLREAGVDAYNHNLNTAESKYAEISTTHTYADRVETVERAKGAGLSPCSGLIVGMGESDAQVVEAVLALRELDSDSIPVNFLMPFEGTPLAGTWELTPLRCLRILALVRLACPDTELRLAGGREMHLRGLQATALEVANSLFLGDYLTSEGQTAEQDLAMIADAGFRVLGAGETPGPEAAAGQAAPWAAVPAEDAVAQATTPAGGSCGAAAVPGGPAATPCGSHAAEGAGCGCCSAETVSDTVADTPAGVPAGVEPRIRRRGAGTAEAPNA
ncbi:biotin synthase BioB [Citricoccus sp. SGAir0253]|uniref:biotin synthase BioB n=1 Tax=Citricoccus sp. SGAir0253 TaxID=2567881 RepID=UPI001FEEC905|nr:biotin synthase BioB [Citricoccus sp. SGAir0253]